MKRQKSTFCGLLLLFFSSLHAETPFRLVMITGGNSVEEERAWLTYAQAQGWELSIWSWKDALSSRNRFERHDAVWIHQTLPAMAPEAMKARKKVNAYLQSGGRLFLSMEAVRLLHLWGIEPNALETRTDTVRDEGFGRPLGFHAFKDHPVFSGMHGGAYPSKLKADHLARKTGFFGKQLPGNPAAKVIGIEWTYITFHEEHKLVLEYPVGKGKVLAAGAFLQFAPDNYNRSELERFCQNALRYLKEGEDGFEEASFYWSYGPAEVRQKALAHPVLPMPQGRPWTLPALSIAQDSEAGDDSFFDLAGRRILVMGKEQGGIDEIWTHPFMSARDIRLGIFWKDTLLWLAELTPKVTISPEMLVREYRIEGVSLREVLTISFDKPVALAHYEFPDHPDWRGFAVQATFNARFMWPYDVSATRSIEYDYHPARRSLAVLAQDGALAAWMGFSEQPEQMYCGRYSAFSWNGSKGFTPDTTTRLQVGACMVFGKPEGGVFNLALAGSNLGMNSLLDDLNEILPRLDSLYLPTGAYYRALLANQLSIESPDPVFNQGYKWAMARTDQMFQTTPGLGTTHMAGFGTTARGWNGRHEVSGRPGYAWYFGRDGEWSGMAVNAYGDFAWVKEMLKVFAKYQSLDGKILHELTSSGAVHYDASDATPLYLVFAAHYLRYSGDLAFIRELWPSLEKALQFCYRTDTDGDGLIENTNVGHGWIEGGALFGTHTEFYLAGAWAACLDAAAYIAGHLGKAELSAQYAQDAARVKTIIERDFWDAGEQYFYNGKMRDGTFMQEATVLQAVPIYLQAVPDERKARAAVQPFAGQAFSPDWGIRMIAADNAKFNPRSYHAGMVWPLYGGWASLAEYQAGFYNSAFFHFYANLVHYQYWGKGSVEETLHGMEFRPAGVCSHQCWSETMVLLPIIEGMLGLSADALQQRVTLAPKFPWHWDNIRVRNMRIGENKIHMAWSKYEGSTRIQVQFEGDQPLSLALRPAFPLGTRIRSVWMDGQPVPFSIQEGPEGIEVLIAGLVIAGEMSMMFTIEHEGGVGAVPMVYLPVPDEGTRGARFIGQEATSDGYVFTFEGIPGNRHVVQIWSAQPIRMLEGGTLLQQKGSLYDIQLPVPATETPYMRIYIK